jgi:hypothetical protein
MRDCPVAAGSDRYPTGHQSDDANDRTGDRDDQDDQFTPAPTTEPTTIAVSVITVSFCVRVVSFVVMNLSPGRQIRHRDGDVRGVITSPIGRNRRQ